MKIAYLTGEYPRATDTFIQREVAALRAEGVEVPTCSIRRTGDEHLVGEEQRQEAARTFHVLPAVANPLTMARAELAMLPRLGRYFRALALAWRTAPKGIKGRAYNLIYFTEAVVLAHHLRKNGVQHLHNHIAKSSCTVAMLASELSGIPYSFTLHGPDIFFAPDHWRLDEKIARARFVACISEFCRSQAMFFSAQGHWGKLKIIHCGVDPDRYAPGERDGTRLLFVGRLAAVKGVPVLLDALAEARQTRPDLPLTLVGDGPDRSALEALAAARQLAGAVTFAGYKSQTEVADLLARHDALFPLQQFDAPPAVLRWWHRARRKKAERSCPAITTSSCISEPACLVRQKAGLSFPPAQDRKRSHPQSQATAALLPLFPRHQSVARRGAPTVCAPVRFRPRRSRG